MKSLLPILLAFACIVAKADTIPTPVIRKAPATSWETGIDTLESPTYTLHILGGIGTETVRYLYQSPNNPTVPPLKGQITLEFPGLRTAEEYTRSHDPATGIAATHIIFEDIDITRQTFISPFHRAVIMHLSRPLGSKKLNFRIRLTDSIGTPPQPSHHTICLRTRHDDTAYESQLTARTGYTGAIVAERDGLRVIDADEATLILIAGSAPVSDYDLYSPVPRHLHRHLSLHRGKLSLRSYEKILRQYMKHR